MTETTRAKSVKKPADHQPKKDTTVTVKFADETFEIEAKLVTSGRTIRLLEKGMIMSATERLLGEEGAERLLDAIEAKYGDDDLERVSEFTQAVFSAAEAKN